MSFASASAISAVLPMPLAAMLFHCYYADCCHMIFATLSFQMIFRQQIMAEGQAAAAVRLMIYAEAD